jgi:FeS assembly SUF system protein
MSSYNPLSILGRPEPKRESPVSAPEIPREAAGTTTPAITSGAAESDTPVEIKPINPAPGSVEERVVDAIKECYDPEIPVNIHDLGLIYGIDVSPEAHVKITMTLTAPNCPAAQQLPVTIKNNVEEVEGVESAEVNVVFDPPWTPEKMTMAAKLVTNIL